MLKRSKTSGQVERLLWHGTAIDALDNIYAGGFNRAYCGKNGTSINYIRFPGDIVIDALSDEFLRGNAKSCDKESDKTLAYVIRSSSEALDHSAALIKSSYMPNSSSRPNWW